MIYLSQLANVICMRVLCIEYILFSNSIFGLVFSDYVVLYEHAIFYKWFGKSTAHGTW